MDPRPIFIFWGSFLTKEDLYGPTFTNPKKDAWSFPPGLGFKEPRSMTKESTYVAVNKPAYSPQNPEGVKLIIKSDFLDRAHDPAQIDSKPSLGIDPDPVPYQPLKFNLR